MPRTEISQPPISRASHQRNASTRTPIAKRRRTVVRTRNGAAQTPQHEESNMHAHVSECPQTSAGERNIFELQGHQDDTVDSMATEQQPASSTRTASWCVRSDFNDSDDFTQMPRNCAVGVPVAMGTAVEAVTGGKSALETAVMSSIQADNFKFVRHMIISGWSYSSPNQSTFSVTINRLGADRQVKEDWHVSNASPLHYAISCGSLQAAAALLIAFPELTATTCTVEIESEGGKRKQASWTPPELASFFAELYKCVDQPRHEAYRQAACILHSLVRNPSVFPYVHRPSAKERLLAAGSDIGVVMAAFAEASP